MSADGAVTANIDGTEIPSSQITIEDMGRRFCKTSSEDYDLTEEQVLKNAGNQPSRTINLRSRTMVIFCLLFQLADLLRCSTSALPSGDNKPGAAPGP